MTTNKKWAVIIGIGMAISPIHSLWLTNLVTEDGVVGFFIPAFGTAIWLMGSLLFLVWSKQKIDWGSKLVFIPMLAIVAAMGISGAVNGESLQDKFAPLGMGLSLFAIYLSARVLGKDIFLAFIPLVVIVSISCVIAGIMNPGMITGGLITNYCASAGFIIFGTIVSHGKWQWILISVALVGLFFIGALEAVFIVGVLFVAMIIRKDWNKQAAIVSASVVVLAAVWAALGFLTVLYEGNHNVATLFDVIMGRSTLTSQTLLTLTSGRWPVIVEAIHNFNFIGHGYSLGTASSRIVHNIPLIIMHQIGPLAATAWLFVTVFCLVKTKWKYAWIAIMAASVFDHYLWTQFAPLWWVLAGVSTASTVNNDLIFKKVV